MGERSARVDVLTAEVRALMVGSRQVTLSVYRQLDTVKPNEIEPFGRVRDSKDDSDSALYVYVIGRHRSDGALVRSECPSRVQRKDALSTREIDREAERRLGEAMEAYRLERVKARNAGLPVPEPAVPRLGVCRGQVLDEQWVPVPLCEDWKALPLIVLAGLP